jgi:uncharacterized protein (TIGR01777 family)
MPTIMSRIRMAERVATLPFPAEAVREWHQRPGAFARRVPPWERVEVLEPDPTRAICRLRLGPLAVRCVITQSIVADTPDSSRVTDRCEWDPPAIVGRVSARALGRRLHRLLGYGQDVRLGDLEEHGRFLSRPRLHVAVTGASGLLGSALVPFLTSGGHRVTRLVRRAPGAGQASWDGRTGELAELRGVDAVVHLAGENIGARWTAARKQRIRESRSTASRGLAESLAQWAVPPRALVSASAVGIYGNRGDAPLTESSVQAGVPEDFLAAVAGEWEAATEPARARGIRTVSLRFGEVLSPAGGALKTMLPAFRLGLGGPIGGGRQWLSWIAIDDAVGAIHHGLMTDLDGPVNATAPEPVTNREFTASLARVLHRPAVLPIPSLAVGLVLGEMGKALLLSGARVLPHRLLQSGFEFRLPMLEPALRHVLGREPSG